MTQQEQDEFRRNLEAALSWMQTVQERLRVNDNTRGPRAELEARLRATEEIRESEHEGRMKMDMVLVAAGVLLQNGDGDVRQQTHAKLKELKAMWEETSTYIIHCHSRIEWVWLHWSEYLKAYEEFELWLAKMRRFLEPEPELQLGAREKLWQLDHHRVLLSDAHSQAVLLERLLDEAVALHSRTQDPSVGPDAQQELQDDYNQVKDKAEERVALLQKIAEEHQIYESCAQKFLDWAASIGDELNRCVEMEGTADNKLQALQDLCENVVSEEATLRLVESRAEGVKAQSSPGGAEAVTQDVEQLREAWEKLRQRLLQEQENLHTEQRSEEDYATRATQLRTQISQLGKLVKDLGRELEAPGGEKTEDEMAATWRKYKDIRSALAAEEPRLEQLKVQLRELFHFSQDAQPLSDEVLALVKEYQGVNKRAFRLSTETEDDLKRLLQDPLWASRHWIQLVTQLLEASVEMSEYSHFALLVQNMETLLKHSLQLQERLSNLQVKEDLLCSVFGPEQAKSLLKELSAAMRDREQLHSQLVERKSHLQGLLLRSQDFGDAYETTLKKLALIRERLISTDSLQPDILAKKSLSGQLKLIMKDLEDCEAHVTALETLVSSNPSNRRRFDQLHGEWRELFKTVRVKVSESEQGVAEHEDFQERLLAVQKWLMVMKQKLESFRGTGGEWSVENRQNEAERALGEFPEKEQQLHMTEAHGKRVLARTSEEGKVHILQDLQCLRESWMSLHDLSLNVFRLLNGAGALGSRDVSAAGDVKRGQKEKTSTDRDVLLVGVRDVLGKNGSEAVAGSDPSRADRGPNFRVQGTRGGNMAVGLDHSVEFGLSQNVMAGGEEGRAKRSVRGGGDRTNRDCDGKNAQDYNSPWKAGVDMVDLRGGYSSQSDARDCSGGAAGQDLWQNERGTSSRGTSSRGMMTWETRLSGGTMTEKEPPGAETNVTGSARVDGASQRGQVGLAEKLFQRDKLQREFEAWLQEENGKLYRILCLKGELSSKELRVRQQELRDLRSRVGLGQSLFQKLLASQVGYGAADIQGLEELRYRWMLYKSKLKDVKDLKAHLTRTGVGFQEEEPMEMKKTRSRFLSRVCWAALPLQLLLLSLLLLAFLLPLTEESTSCSLANNFARSFSLMLRYDGPPPT